MLRRISIFSRASLDPRTLLRAVRFKPLVSTALRPSSQVASLESARQQVRLPQLPEETKVPTLKLTTETKDLPIACAPYTSYNQKKTVVIIGGRSQVGETLRNRFLASGWNVVCTTQGPANHKLDERGFHLEGDVNIGDKKAWTKKYWEKLFTKIQSEQGPIHTVVNCAGISINDPNTGYTMDDINRKSVAPTLEACIELLIRRYTLISTQAAKYPEARKPGSYSKSKYEAEQDITKVMASKTGTKTQTTILRPDLIISADNPGHFGSPQRMSTIPFVKLTVGYDPKKAGSTLLQPTAAYDVADAVVNISDYNISTPDPIDACGPEAHSIEDLMSFFKARQHKKFAIGIKIPTAAITPAATIRPWGAFERDHLDLIAHHEKHQIGKIDTTEFKSIVALSRTDKSNPLLTLKETFDFTKRPVFGTHGLDLYLRSLSIQVKAEDTLAIFKGLCIGLTQSRIDFYPNKKTAQRGPNDGVNAAVILATVLGTGLAARFYKDSQGEDKDKPSNTKPTIEQAAPEIHAGMIEEETRRMISVGM